jgi:hypothetical protein
MKPKQNDCVLFTPHDPRRRRVAGIVQDVFKSAGSDRSGYNIFSPLPSDPTRVQRVWAEDGTIEVRYRIVRKSVTDEWLVVRYFDRKPKDDGAYYTNDKNDATDTLIFIAAQETIDAEKPSTKPLHA